METEARMDASLAEIYVSSHHVKLEYILVLL